MDVRNIATSWKQQVPWRCLEWSFQIQHILSLISALEAQNTFLCVICFSITLGSLLRSVGAYWWGHSGLVLCRPPYTDAQGDLGPEAFGKLERILRCTLLPGPSQADLWALGHGERTYASHGDLEGQSQLWPATGPLVLWSEHRLLSSWLGKF